ncbi:hypothetical protein EN5CB1_29170 [Tepidimicrobium xylanilyticum]|nr:hypothetical protein EN5CB1_29170 [Tepidimicrobium xylanilyticum]
MPYDIFSLFERREAISANFLFTDMIKPDKYQLNFNEKNHTFFYSDDDNNLWTSSRVFLADIFSSNSVIMENISAKELLNLHNSRSIVFYFPENFNTYILARSLGVQKPGDIVENIADINRIYFYLGAGEPYIIFSNGKENLKVYSSNLNLDSIKNRLKAIENADYTYYYPIRETLNVNNDIYIPYRMSKNLPIVYVENELKTDDIEEMRGIAEIFFKKDIDYIREIIENNGSILYLYNQKVLKINQNGLLEYFSPLEEPVKERNLYISLNTTSEFLSNHLGVPKDLYLSKIEEIESEGNLGYRLTFKYRIRGIPVILSKDIAEDFIQIDVFNSYIRNYKRFIRRDMNININEAEESKQMLSTYYIINNNYQLLEKGYLEDNKLSLEAIDEEALKEEVLSSIKDISLTYLDPCNNKQNERLIGVWLLKVGNRTYAFDAYDGELLFSEINS